MANLARQDRNVQPVGVTPSPAMCPASCFESHELLFIYFCLSDLPTSHYSLRSPLYPVVDVGNLLRLGAVLQTL